MSDVNEVTVPELSLHAVLYSDGGYHADEQVGGWGVHGYTFTPGVKPTKGAGHPKAAPTDKGYVADKKSEKVVKVESYVDAFGGVPKARSNNETELLGAKAALTFLLENPVEKATVYSDSKYVVEGINTYRNRWKQSGWRNSQGLDIANKDIWLSIDAMMEKITAAKKDVELAWIKGHDGNAGNERADWLAGKGNCVGRSGYDKVGVATSQPEGYWKTSLDYNRLLDQPKWYFDTSSDSLVRSKDGRNVVMTGNHGDDDDTGKPKSDCSNAVLFLKEDQPVFDKIREHFVALDKLRQGHLFIGALRNILRADVVSDIENHGLTVFRSNRYDLGLTTEKKVPLIHHVTPIGTAYNNVANLAALHLILERVIEGDKALIRTDLTDLLYETSENKGTVVRKLRKDITSMVKHLDVSVNYNVSFARDLRAMSEIPMRTAKVRLVVGQDIIGRNALAALADSVKRVSLITWRESDSVFRYASVIESGDDIGIWANMFGNFKLIK